MNILIADDDHSICFVLRQACERAGHNVEIVHDSASLLEKIHRVSADVIITDVMMPGESGLDILPRIREIRPNIPVIVISAQSTLITAVKARELGAYDYLPKPFDIDILLQTIANATTPNSKHTLAFTEKPEAGSSMLIGHSQSMQDVYRILARVVGVDLAVLISGESGTGKELVARALHSLSKRKQKPFIALNMAAIPRDLVESELFGHERGAFTGATSRKAGAFEQAEGGMLFLDEIGDMPAEAQTRLLRVLQQGEYTPVGGTRVIKSNVRIVSATHADLASMVSTATFRKDLYYRLNVVQVRMPALRERKDDIADLVSHFLVKAQTFGLPRKEMASDALPHLEAYSWPGNVRELENLVYRLSTLCNSTVISAQDVQKELAVSTQKSSSGSIPSMPLSEVVREHVAAYFRGHGSSFPTSGLYDRLLPLFEKPLIEVTLKATQGNQFKTAHILGINRNTLRKKINELHIDKHAFDGDA